MPAGISALAPSNPETFNLGDKELPAFTILQKDGLDSSLPLLHAEDDMDFEMSNKIISQNLYNQKQFSRSNDHLLLASLQNQQSNPLKAKHSKSQGNLNRDKPEVKAPMILSTEDFTEVLNAKLRKVREEEDHGKSRKLYTGNNNNFVSRKPFITTVKTGEFLMPPPEVASLLGIAVNSSSNSGDDPSPRSKFRPLNLLTKKPEIRHQSHHSRCQAALKATTDFSMALVNSAAPASEPNRWKRSAPPTQTEQAPMPRALPKKLEPIPSTILPNRDQPVPFGNIMFDRRVVRGSTFASTPMPVDSEQSQAALQAEARRRQLARRRAQTQASRALHLRIGSPPPVSGRKHEPVQTETYLEELFEKPDEFDIGTQTDHFLDRPPTPLYCPAKVGTDQCTQIYPGDLFDYDVEVQPIIEVLVGKTIEQSLIEVLEEEEVATLREQQRKFLELREAEKAEAQRLEEQERRLREEKCRRLKQHEEAVNTQLETEERVAAAVLLTGYIAELLPAVLEGLKMSGFLLDEIKADVEEGFMPWLMKEVKKEMGNMIESRELLMDIIREILENRAETYRRLGEDYDASRDQLDLEEQDEGEGEGDTRDVDFVDYEPPALDDVNPA
ncbi:radial spoke head protein 3 homolog A isoform X1 [Neodiprion lecontei]|uniref:Radial spoke head protein 3 homolog A isoform X1 n=1 Tax=Neodiprion lecontei TaxID=441921 RepID=A0ABM3FCD8_NEOLC|nr:radial spoke head protein 3 homolog A isoform X1 [Neodiprion lecontei]XP_046585686.1 radial spoke head protein 3 homolog A isoform X1 [Neodiprion lecontei]